jgi:hypothetical protein
MDTKSAVRKTRGSPLLAGVDAGELVGLIVQAAATVCLRATSRFSVLNRPSPVDAGLVIQSTGLSLAARLGVRSWAGLRRRSVGERIAGGLAALATAEGGGEYEQPLPGGGVPTAAKLP